MMDGSGSAGVFSGFGSKVGGEPGVLGREASGRSRWMRPVKARAVRRVSLWTADRIFRRMMLATGQARHGSLTWVMSSVAPLAGDTGDRTK